MYIAKSYPKRESIEEHTDNLIKNYERLKNIYGENIDMNWELLKLACLYHDLGKMNRVFQAMINKKSKPRGIDNIPHGYLSVMFVDYKKLKKEYGFKNNDIDILANAIAHHHLREEFDQEMKNKVIDYKPYLVEDAEDFYYDKLPEVNKDINTTCLELVNRSGISGMSKNLVGDYILIKGLLNKIDYAASGNYEIEYRNDFLEGSLDNHKKSWGEDADYNDLQKFMIENRDENVIAVAETGYGKTEAGLLWIGNNKGFFTLPLRSAINSIYDRIRLDILKEEEDFLNERLGLLHSDSLSELYMRKESKEDGLDIEDLEILEYNSRTRQKSLPLTISTIDQIFKFVYKYEGFEEELASLAYSKIVIDEIQMYSADLLAYLIVGLDMIDKVGGKFSIITATLPPFILDLLKERIENIKEPEKPYFNQNRLRHRMEIIEDDLNYEFVKEKYKDNKILVIANTVKKVQEIYEGLEKDLEGQVHMFHGSYIKKDRRSKEKEILEFGKRDSKDSGIWICTQVAEASLDIDFDILITELSDLNGLFQRMGRCYRNRNIEDDKSNIYVFDGGDNICSGIGFVNDRDIFDMSKSALREELKDRKSLDMGEEKKLDLINKIYTSENIKDTKYFKDVITTMEYIEGKYLYELSKSKVVKTFRNINSIDIIPRPVYEENKDRILGARDILKKPYSRNLDEEDKKRMRLEKVKARILIDDLSVSIPYYFRTDSNTEEIEITKYENLFIYQCEYDKKLGLRHIKEEVEDEYKEDVENIL